MLTIFDFEAVVKHSYYGQQGRTSDTLICSETGEEVVNWLAGASDFLTRYMASLDNPRKLIVAHDMGRDYRTAFFPGYKAKRKLRAQSPTEKEQIEKLKTWAKSFLSAIGATQIGVKGVEADDVIAWLCTGQEVTAIVHSVDHDLLQLVTDKVAVSLKGETHWDAEGELKGVPYKLTSFSKAILGDSSDEYKGIPGMGEKAWLKLFEALGEQTLLDVEKALQKRDLNLFERLLHPHQDNKEVAKLLANWTVLVDQYRLSSLHPELCWRPRAKKLVKPIVHKRVPNPERTKHLLHQVGADDLYDSQYAEMMPTVTLISADNWDEWLPKIKSGILSGEIVAYDYETSDKKQIERFRRAATKDFVDNLSQELTGMSLCYGEFNQHVLYLTIDHKDSPNLSLEQVKELLIFIAQQANKVTPVAHNAFFEGTVTQKQLGISFGGVQDTRVMHRYFDENSPAGLKFMSNEYLGYEQASYNDTLAAAGVDMMCEMTWQQAIDYGADDALVTAHLYDFLKLMLQLDGSWLFYKQWAVDPTVVLQSAYLKGVRINWPMQKRLHMKDLETVKNEVAALRVLLEANADGVNKAGALSVIEADGKYQERSRKAKSEDWRTELGQWKHKLMEACLYQPYMESTVMPAFAFTPKQLSAATEKIGLPVIEKVTLSYLGNWFAELGVDSFDPVVYEGSQKEFIDALQAALKQRVDKLSKDPPDERQAAFDKLAEVTQRLAGVEPRTIKSGDELNLKSSPQMIELLYCKLGIPVRLFGKASAGRKAVGIWEGAPSTDEDAINTALALDAEGWQVDALKHLLRAKSATTRISLYHNKLPLWVHEDGRIHPFILDAGTDTRRPTGSAPNILQIPARGEGAAMRSLYVPPNEDYVCVAIDFSGQELRILASESGDAKMLEAYTPGAERDIHSLTGVGIVAKRVAKNPELAPLLDYFEFDNARGNDEHPLHPLAAAIRDHAKPCNFGLAYGSSEMSIARKLIIPLDEGKELLDGTMGQYPGIPAWQERTAKFMEQNGFTITAWGTKRHANPDIFSSVRSEVSRQHRQGINATIQGAAAESLRTILTKLHTEGHLYNLRMEFFAPIYDEIVSWVHKDDVVEYCKVLHRLMIEATPPGHIVSQIPEFSIGADWGRTHELGRLPADEVIIKAVGKALEEAKEMWATDLQLTHQDVYPEMYQNETALTVDPTSGKID